MANINQFVKVGFTIEKATSLAEFFSNVGYLCTATASDFVSGVIPTNNHVTIPTIDVLDKTFKSSTQYYKDIQTILMQQGNNKPNQSGVGNVIVYVGTLASGEDYSDLVKEFISVNGNFARLTIDSRVISDIFVAAKEAQAKNRRFIAQTSSATILDNDDNNIAKQMKDLDLSLVDLDYHSDDTEALACADMAIATQEIMGSVGDLYSVFTGVTPKNYLDAEQNLKDLNVSYYTSVAFIDGGNLDQYAQKLLLGGYTITGIDRKSADIEYYFDKIFKARGLDFLAKKYTYQDSSAKILQEMLTRIMVEGQLNNLIIEDSIDEETGEKVSGFKLKVIMPSVLRRTQPTAWAEQKYLVNGYYYDAKIGRRIEINFYVNPQDYELKEIGF